jgi:microcystin-dependent protein
MGQQEKNRADLKKAFKKGETPKEADFQDLINATFNKKDDRMDRPPNAPLTLITEDNGEALLLRWGDMAFLFKLDNQGNLSLGTGNVVVPAELHAGRLTIRRNKLQTADQQDLLLEAGKDKNVVLSSPTQIGKLDVYTKPEITVLEGRDGVDFQLFAALTKRLLLGPAVNTDALKGAVCADQITVNGLTATQQLQAKLLSASEKVTAPLLEATKEVKSPLVSATNVEASAKVTAPEMNAGKQVSAPKVVASSELETITINATGTIKGRDIDASGKIKENGNDLLPKGMIVMWSGQKNNIPGGWVLCDGTNETPDLRDRFLVGAGGKYSVNEKGGFESITLNASQIPSHSHSFSVGIYKESVTDAGWAFTPHSPGAEGGYKNGTTGQSGSDQPHENRPPYFALCFIMKT